MYSRHHQLIATRECPVFLQKDEVRRRHIRLHMEGALTARDKVGVQDFVLLDAYTSESAFVENLRKRFSENLIYVMFSPFSKCVSPFPDLAALMA